MKSHTALTSVFLLTATLASCTEATPEPAEAMINPGDDIDGMMFTPIDEMDWDVSLAFLCDWESLEETDTSNTVSCFAPHGREYHPRHTYN